MSEKMTCPGCGSHTSDVLRAFAADEPCPYCGLSSAAAVEVMAVRAVKADAALKEMTERVIKERDEWRKRALAAEYRFGHLKDALEDMSEIPSWVFESGE